MNAHEDLAEVARRIHPQAALLRTWPLTGGVSAQVTAFEIALPGGRTQTLVLRIHGEMDRTQNPHVAAHEFRLLRLLRDAGLPAPVPVFFDQSAEVFPAPYIVVEYGEGQPLTEIPDVSDEALRQMAAFLAKLHAVGVSNVGAMDADTEHKDAARTDLSFLRRMEHSVATRLKNPPATLDDSLHEERIRDVLATAWPLPQRNRPVLLHGDFWPGNVLWKDRRIATGDPAGISGVISGVIDWEDAAVGDPQADLANARLELFWAFGEDAMYRFTDYYLSLAQIDTANLPYWDLYAALRPIAGIDEWGLGDVALRTMREQLGRFSEWAFDALAGDESGSGAS